MKRIILFLLLSFGLFNINTVKSQDYIDWVAAQYPYCTEGHGLQYNWYTAIDARNIAPSGWHVPTNAEYITLQTYLGGATGSGGKLKETGLTYWNTPNTGATNEVFFNARGSGYRSNTTGLFTSILDQTKLRTTNNVGAVTTYTLRLLNTSANSETSYIDHKNDGDPIRLIKDATSLTDGQTSTMTGNDGKIYRTICIGTQEWTADNIQETKFRDGSIIPWHGASEASFFTNAEWAALTTSGVCAYDNTVSNVGCSFTFPSIPSAASEYGALYNWYTATDSRGFVSGWHLPTNTEFDALATELGGSTVAGGKMKETGLTHWDSPNSGADNSSGFNGIGSGSRSYVDGHFGDLGNWSYLWTSVSFSSTNARYAMLSYDNDDLFTTGNGNKKFGWSIRLIKDDSTDPGFVIIDGKKYNTVTIGTQVWMAENLKAHHFANGDSIPEITDNTTWTTTTTPARCSYDNNISNE